MSTETTAADTRPSIDEFFDPTNVEHLKAFQVLRETGVWPREFWDAASAAHCTFPSLWTWSVVQKLADAYMKEKVG